MSKFRKYTFEDIEVPASMLTGRLAHVSPLALKILYKRGYQSREALEDALFGKLNQTLFMTEMQGTKEALPLLADAIKNKTQIVVYQDYDVDGCAAGAVCLETIRALGGDIQCYVNDREVDGYGIRKHGIDRIGQLYPAAKVILTVDNGITAHDEVTYAKEKGYTIIVTDHHSPGNTLPEADAVIDPKCEDEFYPFHELCGTAVAFKLMLALYQYLERDTAPVLNTIDLVGFATVADIVPLIGENRDFVREALRMMNNGTRPAFQMMQKMAGVNGINAQRTIAYIFAPMVNALSRMGEDPYIATNMLISQDAAFLRESVEFMMKINNERKQQTDDQARIAKEILMQEMENIYGRQTEAEFLQNLPPAIVIKSDEFTEGIIGIVAGRLKNEFYRPVVVLAPSGDGILKASCRSIDGFHLKNNLDKLSDLLMVYGGHAKAAGLSISENNLTEFKQRFLALAETIDEEKRKEIVELDAVLTMAQATIKQIQDLRILEPYGEAFPPPIFGLKFSYDAVRYMGAEDVHVKYWNRQHNLSVIEWHGGEAERKRAAQKKRRTKVIGTLSINEYQGNLSPQFIIEN